MKYDTQLSEVAGLLPNTQNVLVALPTQASVDELAAGLALFLSLEQAGKEVVIVTEGVIRVGHTNLFGVGQIQSKIPEGRGGDYVITLGGVASTGPDGKGTIPSLEKLDYYTQGTDLNLVFKVLPGQKFEPTGVTPHYEGGGFSLIFVIGTSTLAQLGSAYHNNRQMFNNAHIVDIDNDQANTQFGKSNVVDTSASSASEMVSQILTFLGLPVSGDIASNILSGIFAATSDLRERNASADTYEVVAAAIRAGGQRPAYTKNVMETPAPRANPASTPRQPLPAQNNTTPGAGPGFDLGKLFGIPANQPGNFTPTPGSSGVVETEPGLQSSPEEAPAQEGVEVVTPEADWLTPKIFKGKGG